MLVQEPMAPNEITEPQPNHSQSATQSDSQRSQSSLFDRTQGKLDIKDQIEGRKIGQNMTQQIQDGQGEGEDQNQFDQEDEIERLKEEIRGRDQEIQQKNCIIKHLQNRCMLVSNYQEKIYKLEGKVVQLQRLLDKLQKNGSYKSIKSTKQNKDGVIAQLDQYILKQKSHQNLQLQLSQTNPKSSTRPGAHPEIEFQLDNKQNPSKRKSSIKSKPSTSPLATPINPSSLASPSASPSIPPAGPSLSIPSNYNYVEITSSKLLNPPQPELSNEQKYLHKRQIQQKFNKIKQSQYSQGHGAGSPSTTNINCNPSSNSNLHCNSTSNHKKLKSNKNIDEIYSILNGHKMRKEQLAIKGINEKLENILNQSVKMDRSGERERQREKGDLSMNLGLGMGWKNECSHERERKNDWSFTDRPRSDSYGVSGIQGLRIGEGNRTERSMNFNESMFYRPQNPLLQKSFSKMDSKKFNKILNATNVQQVLRARKSTSSYQPTFKQFVNKSSIMHKSSLFSK